MQAHDVVIIGSGLGGLVCGAILSINGYSVAIYEKNRQIGGCLQTFARDKAVLDTGVHYIGGLAEGQQLHKIFKYLGIIDKLKLKRLDMDGFDHIHFNSDNKVYKLAQGYENFIVTLVQDFPAEENAIRHYCDKIKEVCARFPLYNLRSGNYSEKEDVLSISASGFIASITGNKLLQQVLAGNNMLYAGVADKTPFYIHALITNSFIESAWKCIDGGSQIAKYLGRTIAAKGGAIFRNQKVTGIFAAGSTAEYIMLENGDKVYAKHFISNLHPAQTIAMTENAVLRPAYRNRLRQIPNSIGPFLINVVLKKNTFPNLNYNYYHHDSANAWQGIDYNETNWPLTYALFVGASSKDDKYAESITLMTYMRYEDVAEWADTFNTDTNATDRGTTYNTFKEQKKQKLFDRVEEQFPGFQDSIQSYHVATPLTYRDYQGTADGSLYGILKDFRSPFTTFIAPKTKLPNLFLTGQNLNLHGILGVTISSLVTCGELLDINKLLNDIKNA